MRVVECKTVCFKGENVSNLRLKINTIKPTQDIFKTISSDIKVISETLNVANGSQMIINYSRLNLY